MATIDYEKKYKALVEAVKTLKEANQSDEGIQNWVNDNVPELKESDDERISKIITLCLEECVHSDIIRDYEKDKAIAWLEKQGEKDTQVILPTFTFDDVLALQCAMENVKKVQEDKDLYNKLLLLHNKVHDAYTITKNKLL